MQSVSQNKYPIALTLGFLWISHSLISEIARRMIPSGNQRSVLAAQMTITGITCGIFARLSKSESKVAKVALLALYVVCGLYARFGGGVHPIARNPSHPQQNQTLRENLRESQQGIPIVGNQPGVVPNNNQHQSNQNQEMPIVNLWQNQALEKNSQISLKQVSVALAIFLQLIRSNNPQQNQAPQENSQIDEQTLITEVSYMARGLTTFPVEIWNLPNLKSVKCLSNRLTSLPREIGNLTNLKKLDFTMNRLTALPREIGNLINLETLFIGFNQLTILPGEIGNLTNLRELSVRDSLLESLPDSVSKLQNLELLSLKSNHFTAIPECLLSLPSTCIIHMEGNPLSTGYTREFAESLQDMPQAPQFFFQSQTILLEDEFKWWTRQYTRFFPEKEVGIECPQLRIKELDEATIALFLDKVKKMKEYQKHSQEVVNTVYRMLCLLANHPEFRLAVRGFILESLEACYDRTAFYFSKIGTFIEYYNHEKSWEKHEIIDFIVGIERKTLVEKICHIFVEEWNIKNPLNKRTDPLEIHLYVEIKLAKSLGFTANKIMVFECLGEVSDEELERIENAVKEQTKTVEQVTQILLNEILWINWLKKDKQSCDEELKQAESKSYKELGQLNKNQNLTSQELDNRAKEIMSELDKEKRGILTKYTIATVSQYLNPTTI